MEPTSKHVLLNLPQETLIKIIANLSITDQITMNFVCHLLYTLANDHSLSLSSYKGCYNLFTKSRFSRIADADPIIKAGKITQTINRLGLSSNMQNCAWIVATYPWKICFSKMTGSATEYSPPHEVHYDHRRPHYLFVDDSNHLIFNQYDSRLWFNTENSQLALVDNNWSDSWTDHIVSNIAEDGKIAIAKENTVEIFDEKGKTFSSFNEKIREGQIINPFAICLSNSSENQTSVAVLYYDKSNYQWHLTLSDSSGQQTEKIIFKNGLPLNLSFPASIKMIAEGTNILLFDDYRLILVKLNAKKFNQAIIQMIVCNDKTVCTYSNNNTEKVNLMEFDTTSVELPETYGEMDSNHETIPEPHFSIMQPVVNVMIHNDRIVYITRNNKTGKTRITIFDAKSGKPFGTSIEINAAMLSNICSIDNDKMAVLDFNRSYDSIKFFDLNTIQLLGELQLPRNSRDGYGNVTSLAFKNRGKDKTCLLVGRNTGEVLLFSTPGSEQDVIALPTGFQWVLSEKQIQKNT